MNVFRAVDFNLKVNRQLKKSLQDQKLLDLCEKSTYNFSAALNPQRTHTVISIGRSLRRGLMTG
jgi:hypothetical protein